MTTKHLCAAALLLAAAPAALAQAPTSTGPSTELRTGSGQAYPSQQIKIVCPFPAGGGTDVTSRLLGEQLLQRDNTGAALDSCWLKPRAKL